MDEHPLYAFLFPIPISARVTLTERYWVTFAKRPRPWHFRDFLAVGNRSPGLPIMPLEAATGLVIESLVLLWVASEAEEWRDRIVWLPI